MIDHHFRLRAIELREFKSVRDQRVDLGPLTVVVGANSAGKSTLIQAILALAQAVRSESATPEFPLNGSMIRLGTFDETLNCLAEGDKPQIEIKFEIFDNSPMRDTIAAEFAVDLDDEPTALRGRREPRLISWHAFVGPVDNEDDGHSEFKRGFAKIKRLVLSVAWISTSASGDSLEPLCDCDINPTDDVTTAEEFGNLRILNQRYRPGRVSRPVPIDGLMRSFPKEAPRHIDGVVMSGGVPLAFFERKTVFNYLTDVWLSTLEETLLDRQPTLFDGKDTVVHDEDQSDWSDLLRIAAAHAARNINEFTAGTKHNPAFRRRVFGRRLDIAEQHFSKELNRLSQLERSHFARSIHSQGEETFRRVLREQTPSFDRLGEEVLLQQSGAAVEVLFRSGAVAQRFFSNNVEYLGPLREAPHALHDPGPTRTDLGPTGKFAAAVLHAQADSRVVMPAIPGAQHESRRQISPLNDALDAWLQWFGLAEGATSEDLGRLGIGLSVTPTALGRPVDLTSVGVGVSQVLPVLLLCLLARPGTMVILEQPELHLHPKLQQDLADFLLACVETGRQLVIETHSEHLVNRLRRRVAADASDETRDLVKLIFAENTEGVTTYRESKINRYGGLDDDWPDGFLDVGSHESRALIRESALKRRRDLVR